MPLLDVWIEPPVAAGLHAFRFADHGLRLAAGPESGRLRRQRAALLEQVGLGALAAQPGAAPAS